MHKALFVEYIGPGVGAYRQDVQSKLREFVSIWDYLPESERDAITAGTSTYDCTTGIRNAIAASNKIFFPPGTYTVTPTAGSDPFAGPVANLNLLTGVHWLGYGAIIKASDSSVATGYSWLLKMRLCEDVTIEGITFDGNRANRPAPFNSASHCITILGGTGYIFRDVKIINSTYDGMLIWPNNGNTYAQYPNKILLENVWIDNSYRNGLSITGGYDITIRGGRYCNSNGTLPEDGIDIEPDPSDEFGVKDVIVDGVWFEGNAGCGIELTGNIPPAGYRCENIVLTNISGRANEAALIHLSRVDGYVVDGVTVCDEDTEPTMDAIVYADSSSLSGSISNVTFKNVTTSTKPYIYVENGLGEPTVIRNLRASDIAGKLIQVESTCHIDGVYVDGDTSTNETVVVHTLAPYSSLRNVSINGKASGVPVRMMGTFCVAENISVIDCANAVRMEGANNKYRNISAYNTGTASSYAFYMDTATGVIIENVDAKDNGGYWTNSTTFSFDAGLTSLSGARIRNAFPSPLMGSDTWNPASIADGGSATKTVSVTRADIGDAVRVGHSVSLAGLQSTAYVSAANTVTVVLSNQTGGAVDLASHTVTVEVIK